MTPGDGILLALCVFVLFLLAFRSEPRKPFAPRWCAYLTSASPPTPPVTTTLWLVGAYFGECDGRAQWEFQGIFSSEEAAVRACAKAWYFVAPVTLNESLPDDTVEWPGLYYPHQEAI